MSATYILSKKTQNHELNRRYNDRNQRKKKLRNYLCGEDR